MKLKIKDNVNLEILEELGFDYNDSDYLYTNDGTLNIIINKDDKTIRCNVLDFKQNLHLNSDEFCTNNYFIPTIIYTLIKMDLIEII